MIRTRQAKRLRVAALTALGIAVVITLLAATLVGGAFRNDVAINAATGSANAEVISVRWDRTIVRFETPDGVVHISQDGVFYPGGLVEGQRVHVEYDATNPNRVRVAGRSFTLSLLPASTTVLFTWLVAGPLVWWVRRRRPSGSEWP